VSGFIAEPGWRCVCEARLSWLNPYEKLPAIAKMRPVLFPSTKAAPCTVGRTRNSARPPTTTEGAAPNVPTAPGALLGLATVLVSVTWT
jgi:hypothetical protein